ncbi:MAG: endonuclease/exonuclease/phosphatase family protein [Candidatus Tectomicrobia bacterium]|nr:endonuclease/exonuclease/phosphatase family protein [Candidatus Tectomicrobia bacterium]
MIPLLICIVLLLLLLLGGVLWASGAEMPRITQGSGIIEAIPDALETEPSQPSGQLILLSYRLRYAQSPQAPSGEPPDAATICDRLDQVIETIVASGADIVFLQEADFSSQRTHEIDQLYYIAAALGWGYAARASTWECRYWPWPLKQPAGRIRAGMGVISRYRLVQNVRQRLPQARPYPPLVARLFPSPTVQMVDVQCGGTTLRLLQADGGAHDVLESRRQLQALASFIRDVQTPTSVLMAAQPSSLAELSTELDHRFRVVTDGASSAGIAQALVGAGLNPLETRVLSVEAPILGHPPLVLHLRWALPLMGMNGSV